MMHKTLDLVQLPAQALTNAMFWRRSWYAQLDPTPGDTPGLSQLAMGVVPSSIASAGPAGAVQMHGISRMQGTGSSSAIAAQANYVVLAPGEPA